MALLDASSGCLGLDRLSAEQYQPPPGGSTARRDGHGLCAIYRRLAWTRASGVAERAQATKPLRLQEEVIHMNGMLRVRRSRGVLSGLLLVLLGIWGAIVPFIGPNFHYAYTPDKAWTYTTGRLWLDILPGAAAFLGGLIVLTSSYRPTAHFGAWLAAASGAWFVLGGLIGPTWIGMQMVPGTPVGDATHRTLEQIGFFTGLGVVIVLLAAMAIGRFSVISVRDARRAEREAEREADETPAATTTTSTGRRWMPLRRRVTTTEETDEPATEETAAASRS
jgi:hypothetical protein